MKSNDLLVLRALAQALISLEDLEYLAYVEKDNVGDGSLSRFEKLSKLISDLRADISRLQTDLKISRKIRKGEDTEDILTEIETLRENAHRFYKSKMAYIICPKCDMLLATVWVQYPEVNNKLSFVCNRRRGGDDPKVLCDHKFTVLTKDLWAQKATTNKPEVLPESIL
jgi:hypothetical protein